MTWIKSQLLRPDGAPIEGCCVTATLVTKPGWLDDASAQVTAKASTNTNVNGLWRLDLVPTTEYEVEAVYRIVETCSEEVWYIAVPPETDPGEEHWMRDVLVPPPVKSKDSCTWRPINRLAQLIDVDRASVANAMPGDFLVLLPSKKWGASRGPLPLSITWVPDPDDMFTVHVIVGGFGGAGAMLGWGDGSPEELVTTHAPVPHTYAQPGAFVITVTDRAWPAFTGTATVTIKDHLPRVYPFLDGDDPWRGLLWIDEPADNTKYAISWGDGSPVEQANGQNRVPPRPRVPHQYAAAGRYTITVTDLATQRIVTREIEIGEIGLLITYDSPDRPRITAVWLATGQQWEVEDNLYPPQSGIVPASGRVTVVAGQDVAPGHYWTELREIVGGQARRRSRRLYIHPTQWDWRLGVEMTWRDPADPIGTQTVTVNPTTARSRCTVEWGDGSASTVVDPGQPVSHRYMLPAPATGWRLRLTETLIEDPRTWSRVLGEPRYVGTPVLSARTRGAVDLDISGLDQEYNDDWYQIAWEPGGTPDPVGAVGRWYPANHVYITEGVKQIRVDAPGMPEPITREINVKFYPAPMVTVAEAVNNTGATVDPTRMTAQISVDNSASGGPCTVRVGDNTAPRPCQEIDSFTHRYPNAGSYDVIVTSDADPTAKGRAIATVPFGSARTLLFEFSGEPGGYTVTVTITAHDPAKTVHVQWEGGGQWYVVPPSNVLSHTYVIEDIYDVVVAYIDDSESWSTPIDIPWVE